MACTPAHSRTHPHVHACRHVHIHICMLTHMQIPLHMYIHTHAPLIHTCAHMHVNTHIHTHAHTCSHTCVYTFTYVHTHDAQTHMHTRWHNTHTCTRCGAVSIHTGAQSSHGTSDVSTTCREGLLSGTLYGRRRRLGRTAAGGSQLWPRILQGAQRSHTEPRGGGTGHGERPRAPPLEETESEAGE